MSQLKPGEVRLRVHAAGINRADILQRQGKYPPPPGVTDVLGLEVAGEVVEANGGALKVGDKVCAILDGGGYAREVIVPATHCLPKPDHLSWIEAAALPEAVFTVYANVFEAGKLQAGETVLLHGGASGIGTIGTPMIKLAGGKVVTTAGSDEKCKVCRERGADLAINYTTQDFVDVITQQLGKKSIDIVLDMLGGAVAAKNLSVMAPNGRHVSIAIQKGRMAEIDLWHIMAQQIILTGSKLRSRSAGEKARLASEVAKNVWPWVMQGKLKPLIYKTFPLNVMEDAHKTMESGAHHGKLVLTVDAA